MEENLVSIIIPTYNRADLLPETLNSIIAQTYTNWECIVVDDGSTDNTAELLDAFTQKDSRIQYYPRPSYYNPGGNGARNFGFVRSNGEFIKWLDSDDLLGENQLEKEAEALRDETVSLSISNWKYLGYENSHSFKLASNKYSPDEFLNHLGNQNHFIGTPCYLVKKETVLRAGLWNEFLKVNQDGEFFFRIYCYSQNVFYNAECSAIIRRANETNLSYYGDFKKMSHRINSWKIIESNAKLTGIGSEYIRASKKRLYSFLLKTNRTDFIKSNYLFFSEFINFMDFPTMYFRHFKTKFLKR